MWKGTSRKGKIWKIDDFSDVDDSALQILEIEKQKLQLQDSLVSAIKFIGEKMIANQVKMIEALENLSSRGINYSVFGSSNDSFLTTFQSSTQFGSSFQPGGGRSCSSPPNLDVSGTLTNVNNTVYEPSYYNIQWNDSNPVLTAI